MNDTRETTRREALPWQGDTVVQFYLGAHSSFPYREQFVSLIHEAYHAFLAGCPRASIIVAGEALLRAIYDKIIRLAQEGHEFEIPRRRRANLRIGRDASPDILFELTDQVSFCEAVKLLQDSDQFATDLITLLYVVKSLRNDAAHGNLPLLDDQWDPDDPRPAEKLEELLWAETFEFPEGYRFVPSSVPTLPPKSWFTVDLRKYTCGSLKSLSFEEQFAAIQYLLVLEALTKLSDTSQKAG